MPPSRRLTLAATLLRVLRFKLTDYTKRGHLLGCLFLLVQRQGEFASLYVWYLPSLPLANSLACQGFALAMPRQAERRSLRKVSVTVPSLASSGPE